MTTETAAEESPATPVLDRWDLAAAVILSLATLASAWSSYQAARWSTTYGKENRAAVQARFAATKESERAGRRQTIDVTTFSVWLEAWVRGNTEVADEIRERFRPELAVAFDEWFPPGQDQSVLPPGTPFDLESYRSEADESMQRLLATAEERTATADEASQTGDTFILTAVLYASVLFFAGIATKLSDPRAEHLAVGLSGTMFVVATAVVLSLPHTIYITSLT